MAKIAEYFIGDICDVYLCSLYILPDNYQVYTIIQSELCDCDLFEMINNDCIAYSDLVVVSLSGDLNNRIGENKYYIETMNKHRYVDISSMCDANIIQTRLSDDKL